MKTFSFFTMKGGCGKTSLTILLAAYLRYHKGKTVKVIDFEAPKFPINHFREADLDAAMKDGTPLHNFLLNHSMPEAFPIDCSGQAINTITSEQILSYANSINEEIRKDLYEYLLMDFPAGFSKNTIVSCLVANGLLDAVYIPTSTESQERLDSYMLGMHFLKEKQRFKIVWNRIKKKYIEDPSKIDLLEKELAGYGLSCAKPRIKDFNKATEDSNVQCFVRNTLCWPDRYVEMYCPELVDLFEDVISFLGE